MFAQRTSIAPSRRALGPGGMRAVSSRPSSAGLALRVAPFVALLSAALPGGVSAQALGTMQVTARVVPAEAGWSGLAAARTLAREVLSRPAGPGEVRWGDVARIEAAMVSGKGPRELLVTVDYPRN